MEIKHRLGVWDRHLAEHRFLTGDDYTIAGMTKRLYDPICLPTLDTASPVHTGRNSVQAEFPL
jgi:hypothetical protein